MVESDDLDTVLLKQQSHRHPVNDVLKHFIQEQKVTDIAIEARTALKLGVDAATIIILHLQGAGVSARLGVLDRFVCRG